MITNKNIIHLITLIQRKPMDFAKLDHDTLLHAATLHRVTGLVYRSLLTYASVPQNLLTLFKEGNQKNHYQALRQLKLLTQINRTLLHHNIPMLCIKGLLLSLKLYGDIGVRTSRDIDILVPQNNSMEVDTLLRQLGFEAINPNHILRILRTSKDISYYHPKEGATVEVHYQLMPPHMAFYAFEELWDNRQCVHMPNGEPFNVLDPEHEWMYLCLHGSYSCYLRLQWLCDIVSYQERDPRLLANTVFQEKMMHYKMTRYYNLARFFIELFYQCPSTAQQNRLPFYYRFSCKLMQRRKPELSISDRILLKVFYWLSAHGYSEKWKFIVYTMKHYFSLWRIKRFEQKVGK